MTQAVILLGLAAFIVGVSALAYFYRKLTAAGRSEAISRYNEHEAENARRVSEVATNDNPDAVRERLRDGEF